MLLEMSSSATTRDIPVIPDTHVVYVTAEPAGRVYTIDLPEPNERDDR
jgi:hypothetical protein